MRPRGSAAALAATTLAIGLAAAAPIVTGTAGAAAVTTTTVAKMSGGGYMTTTKFANGDTAMVYSLRGPQTATQAPTDVARDASGETIHQGGVDINPTPAMLSSDKVKTSPAPNISSAAMVKAIGASAEVQQEFAAQDAMDGVAATLKSATPKAAGARPAAAAAASHPLWDRTCLGGHFASNHGNYYGCFGQYVAKKNGADWYMADHFYATGTMHDSALINPDEITGLETAIHYGSGNTLVNWQPRRTWHGGDCHTKTVSLTIEGVGYTDSFQECPETYGATYITRYTFITKWDGDGDGPHGGSRDTGGVSEDHNPPGTSPSRSLHLYYWWE